MNTRPDGPLTLAEAVQAQLQPEPATPEAEADTPSQEPDQTETEAAAAPDPEPQEVVEEPEDDEVDETLDADGEAEEPVDTEQPEAEADGADYVELEPNTALFDVDGETVTYEEARKGYLRQADYSRSRQKTAQTQRELDAAMAKLHEDRDRYAKGIEALEARLQAEAEAAGGEDLDELWDLDPALARKLDRANQSRAADLKAVEEERQRMVAEQQVQQQQQLQSYVQAEQRNLVEAVPAWRDVAVAKTEKTQIVEYLADSGFSQDEISQVYDHRVIKMLRDAVAGRKVEAAKPKVIKKVAKARPMLKKAGRRPPASTRKRDRVSQAEKRLAQSGEMDDAIALQLARMQGRQT